jgi:hypothetical protein
MLSPVVVVVALLPASEDCCSIEFWAEADPTTAILVPDTTANASNVRILKIAALCFVYMSTR